MGRRGPLAKVPGQVTAIGLANPLKPPAPEPPHGLLRASENVWDEYWESSVAGVIDQRSDMSIVTRWIHYVDEWHRTVRIVKREGFTVIGSQGQPVLSPAATYLKNLESMLGKIENELGLTPLSRAKLGLANVEGKMAVHELNRMALAGDDRKPEPLEAGEVIEIEEANGWTS